MDPATVAMVTNAVMTLGNKVLEGAAGKIGEDAWGSAKATFTRLRSLLALKSNAGDQGLEAEVRQSLESQPALAPQVLEVIKQAERSTGHVLVDNITVNQGAVNNVGTVQGGVTQNLTFGNS